MRASTTYPEYVRPSFLYCSTGDGALGFWAALDEIYPETRHQRCWVHKMVNVLNYLPKSVQPKAKAALHEIWMAETSAQARAAFEQFVAAFGAKYPKAVECLAKDREALLAFYDFPAEHWIHIRSTNVIESSFATIRHRTDRTKGCLTRAGDAGDDLQAGQERRARLAKAARFPLACQSERRCEIPRRDRNERA